ncbi:MAG: ComF family protein [Pyrinomonadaceae bacterium]
MLNKLYDSVLALMYPQPCAVCGRRSVERRADLPACARCWAATDIFNGRENLCWKCGLPTPGAANRSSGRREDVRCRRCEHESFTAARAIGAYGGALRATVLALKREPHLSQRLTHLLCESQRRPPLDVATCIIPVPLHAERLRERGFNQAEVLARALAASTMLPLDEASVRRIKQSAKHRAGMDGVERRQSVLGAFSVERPRLVAGHRVLLVDDVFTTGATVSACAQTLTAAGALDVFVLTVARAT